jgi:NACalpha-BTF3-like transcription factor
MQLWFTFRETRYVKGIRFRHKDKLKDKKMMKTEGVIEFPRIISFSGRISSGKTTLCDLVCSKYGYIPMNFADVLKNLVCSLLNVSIDELNRDKQKSQKIELSENQIKVLCERVSVSREKITKTSFDSFRSVLQYIGSDIIRSNQPNWHIQQIKLEPNVKYCFGDTRFPNEKEFVESQGGRCFFIARPSSLANVSNHPSEISLCWYDFDRCNVIINDSSIDTLESNLVSTLRGALVSGPSSFDALRKYCFNRAFLANCDTELVKYMKTDNTSIYFNLEPNLDNKKEIIERLICSQCGIVKEKDLIKIVCPFAIENLKMLL